MSGTQIVTTTGGVTGNVNVGTALNIAAGALNVTLGSAAGTAAAGNDSRIVDAIQLDGAGYLSNQTLGPMLPACATHAALVAYQPSGFSLAAGHRITRQNYAVPHDYGQLDFVWDAASTAQPNIGMTVCPSWNQTPVPNEAQANGAGVTATLTTNALAYFGYTLPFSATAGAAVGQAVFGTNIPYGATISSIVTNASITLSGDPTLSISGPFPVGGNVALGGQVANGASIQLAPVYTGTLAHHTNGIIPLTVSISAGLSANIIDDGAGALLLNGIPVGRISYTTGVYSIYQIIASGQTVTAAYSYATGAGRWLAQFDGVVRAAWFGLGPSVNPTAAIQAADNYAVTYGLSLFLSCPTSALFTAHRTLTYCASLSSISVNGDCNYISGGTDTGTVFSWNPVGIVSDNYPAICPRGSGMRISNIGVAGITSYSNTGTDIIAVTSGVTTYPINYALAGDPTNYANFMPYSSLAPGLAGFWDGDHTTFINCNTNEVKTGIVLRAGHGHTIMEDCGFSGLIGCYVAVNAESYTWRGTSCPGVLCGMLLNDLSYAGHSGGVGGYSGIYDADWYGCLYGILQVTVYGANNGSLIAIPAISAGIYELVFENMFFELTGEAVARLLPSAMCGPISFGGGGPNGTNVIAGTGIPTNWTTAAGNPTPILNQAWWWCGTMGDFAFTGEGRGNGQCLYTFMMQTVAGSSGYVFRDFYSEYMLGGSYINWVSSAGATRTNFQFSSSLPTFYNPSSPSQVITTDTLTLQRDFSPQANLLVNPEIVTNWAINAGTSRSVDTFANSTAGITGAQIMPIDMQQQLGTNPNVVTISQGTGTSLAARINFLNQPITLTDDSIGIQGWVYLTNATSLVTRIEGAGSVYLYFTTRNFNAGHWFRFVRYGQSIILNASGTTYVDLNIYTGTYTAGTGAVMLLAGITAFRGQPAAPNPFNYPQFNAGYVVGTTSNNFTKLIDSSGNEVSSTPAVNTSSKIVVPTAGGSQVIPQGCAKYRFGNTASVTGFTITTPLPPTTITGGDFELDIIFYGPMTSITWAAQTDASVGGTALPTTVAAGARVKLIYFVSSQEWIHVIDV